MMTFMKEINICYLLLNILSWIVLFIYLGERKDWKKYRNIVCIGYFLVSIFLFSYFNGIVQSIFDLKYLSVKIYLLMVVGVNLIMLFTLNKSIGLGYRICNYILFIIITIIFGSVVAVVLGNKFEQFYVMDVGNAIHFIDLSLVIFLLYLIGMSIIYIGYYLFGEKEEQEESVEEEKGFFISNLCNLKEKFFLKKKKKEVICVEETVPTLEELLGYNREEGFYIDGIECSIIFEDSNQENILKNYQILSNDIHARLVNGYTLDENKMLKNICMKLQVGSLASIDIFNVSLLNKISIDEYNLLRRVFGLN